MELARQRGAAIFAIVGRDGGFAAKVADACVVVPPLYPRSRHTAHRRTVCRHLAFAGQPSRPGQESHEMGEHPMSTGGDPTLTRVCIVGGAGFIGSHFVDRLLADSATEQVAVFDNFSSGREWHLARHAGDRRLNVVTGDVIDLDHLDAVMRGSETVIHLASNPDIARAVTEPAIDFEAGTLLTHHVVEAMRALRGAAHPVRLGQRRLRRPRGARS